MLPVQLYLSAGCLGDYNSTASECWAEEEGGVWGGATARPREEEEGVGHDSAHFI